MDGDTGVTEPRKRSPPAAWTEKHGYPAEDGQPTELYDLRQDAGQRHNLAADRPEQVSELRDRLERIRHRADPPPRHRRRQPEQPTSRSTIASTEFDASSTMLPAANSSAASSSSVAN